MSGYTLVVGARVTHRPVLTLEAGCLFPLPVWKAKAACGFEATVICEER